MMVSGRSTLRNQTLIGALGLALLCGQAAAIESPTLDLPLVCLLGETCWVANYVDVDPAGAGRDFRCQGRTYPAHEGTDFMVRDRAVMEQGVPVLASAAGTVLAIRDGMKDVLLTEKAATHWTGGKECGNGVLIDHGGGWQTQYCHLRKGSVRVRAQERVERGTHLGLVGLSGKTAFPHVHLTVRHNGQVVDPFTGQLQSAGCGKEEQSLWRTEAKVSYEEVALVNAGFAGNVPDIDAIRSGALPDGSVQPTASVLVLWVDVVGARQGDQLRFQVSGPDGQMVVDKVNRVEKTQARRFVYAGQRLRANTWPSGTYSGQVTLTREGEGRPIEQSVTRTVTIQ